VKQDKEKGSESMTVNGYYHALVEDRIFFGGARDVEAMIKKEQVEVIIDLRAETTHSAYPSPRVEWIQIPIGDDSPEVTEQLFQSAIDEVVGFHCGAGSGRAGTVAVGTLLALGLAETVIEAETKAKSIRPIVNMGNAQRQALIKLYPDIR
jgi:protein-tyrosine phosphatase